MWRCSLVAFSISAACQFDRPVDQMPVDAPLVDAAPTCVADTITCAADTYVECGPDGFATRTLACPLGCAPDVAKCLDIDPHNGLAMYLDMVADPPDIVLRGDATILMATGGIFDDGAAVSAPMFEATDHRLRIYVVNSLTIDGRLIIAPSEQLGHGLAFVSREAITIRGTIDVSAAADLAGPGGWPGIDLQHSQATTCIGRPVNYSGPTPGGGGGGGAFAGGTGGGINQVEGGVAGTESTAGGSLVRGGCAGGGIFTDPETLGGGGGGSLQLASRTEIRLENLGTIDASGGGGGGGHANAGGAGGGGGGPILLEAPDVILDGASVVISSKGGGGGGAGSATVGGMPGQDGGTDATSAAGGTSPIANRGGGGGIAEAPQGGADATGGSQSGGGGGGSPGIIQFATRTGTVVPVGGAAIRGFKVESMLTTRHIP